MSASWILTDSQQQKNKFLEENSAKHLANYLSENMDLEYKIYYHITFYGSTDAVFDCVINLIAFIFI